MGCFDTWCLLKIFVSRFVFVLASIAMQCVGCVNESTRSGVYRGDSLHFLCGLEQIAVNCCWCTFLKKEKTRPSNLAFISKEDFQLAAQPTRRDRNESRDSPTSTMALLPSANWRWSVYPGVLASLAASWLQSDPSIVQLMHEKEKLEEKNRDSQAQITALNQQLKEEKDSLVSLKQHLAQTCATCTDSNDAQVLITALKQRLKEEQDANAKLKQKLTDLEKLCELDKAEITKLKNRFNERKVAAEIARLENQVAALELEKKLRDKNRLLALQRHVLKAHCTNESCTECSK
ncbi:unnamed protein product [Phytophthora lilii]|uniref:Unnamed protein product n=1 Tax=Phytophthora lilii TaxID=2077276 RepID=A0A9W6X7S3_9STRA|nr:unnamed protein product [Phytophthora lilii]